MPYDPALIGNASLSDVEEAIDSLLKDGQAGRHLVALQRDNRLLSQLIRSSAVDLAQRVMADAFQRAADNADQFTPATMTVLRLLDIPILEPRLRSDEIAYRLIDSRLHEHLTGTVISANFAHSNDALTIGRSRSVGPQLASSFLADRRVKSKQVRPSSRLGTVAENHQRRLQNTELWTRLVKRVDPGKERPAGETELRATEIAIELLSSLAAALAVLLVSAEIAHSENPTQTDDPDQSANAGRGTDSSGPFSGPGFVREFKELIGEREARELWRESEGLRGAVQHLLQANEDAVPDDARARAHDHLERFEKELHTIGGALGGSVRSYWLSLSQFVADHAIRPALDDLDATTAKPIRSVLDALDTARADTQNPDAIGPPLDAAANLVASDPSSELETLRATFLDVVSERTRSFVDGASDDIQNISDGLDEHRSFQTLNLSVAAGVTAAVIALGAPIAAPFVGAVSAVTGMIFIMAHRTYRISRRPDGDD